MWEVGQTEDYQDGEERGGEEGDEERSARFLVIGMPLPIFEAFPLSLLQQSTFLFNLVKVCSGSSWGDGG